LHCTCTIVLQERARGYKKKNFIQAKYDFIDEMFNWSGSATPEKVRAAAFGWASLFGAVKGR